LKLLGSGLLRKLHPQDYPRRNDIYEHPVKVPVITGSSMFVRYSMLAEVGGMDTNYFLYCEEEDLAYTFRKKGWHCYLVPEARFVHFVSKSIPVIKKDFLQEFYYSQMYFFSKHFSRPAYHCLKWWYFFKLLKKCYKGGFYAHIALMIAQNAPPHYSLRFKQKMLVHKE
jgi:hypothetical protein